MILKQIELDYDFDVFLQADYSVHEGSCIKHQVDELKDIHNSYGGFPDTYCFENTIIRQLWWTASQINYTDIGAQLGMEVITISSILQPPGCVIPLHRDTFFQINKQYPNDLRTKIRANIFLEDWKVGHIIQYQNIDSEWKTSTHWLQGQGFLWDSDILHIGANIGLKDKYTLQISGFLNA